jgi:phosphoglycerate dehydrogenase-like enzyme
MSRIAIINDYQKLALEAADWASLPAPWTLDVSHDRLDDGALAAERLAPYEVVVTAREETRFDRELLERLPHLKLLVTHGMRNAALDFEVLRERGVTVCGTGYGFTMGTVELAWGLILALLKNIPAEDAGIRNGEFGLFLPGALTGKTLGVLGLGDLGSSVARIGAAFGMNVVAWSQNLTAERCAAVGVRLVDKAELFASSDVLSVHLQLSDRTRGLVGADELGRMKKTAFLINTARGPIVDEAALVAALQGGHIAGAGLDVFNQEPLPRAHPLRGLSNTVLSPHIGGRTRENFLARYAECMEDILAWIDGAPLRVLS